jgi:hypothetical protein
MAVRMSNVPGLENKLCMMFLGFDVNLAYPTELSEDGIPWFECWPLIDNRARFLEQNFGVQ